MFLTLLLRSKYNSLPIYIIVHTYIPLSSLFEKKLYISYAANTFYLRKHTCHIASQNTTTKSDEDRKPFYPIMWRVLNDKHLSNLLYFLLYPLLRILMRVRIKTRFEATEKEKKRKKACKSDTAPSCRPHSRRSTSAYIRSKTLNCQGRDKKK